MRRTLTALAAGVAALTVALPTMAQNLPAAEARAENPFRPLMPLIGRTWRGAHISQDGVEDVIRWEWAVGGHAVRAVHAVNGGAYGGETLVFADADTGGLIFHYFTSGGFHTTGTIRPAADGSLEIVETIHGLDDIESLRSVIRIGDDGTYTSRGLVEQDGQWVEFGGFDYRRDDAAVVADPPAPASVTAG